MSPTLPSALPRRGGLAGRWIGGALLRLLGWRVEGDFPDFRKLVLIAAPHRSNWDFVVGIAAKTALNLDISWLGKHTLFHGPWAALFRYWGGIPVDRRTSNDTVAAVVERFAARDRLLLAIAPEGTRTPGVEWKTGFWRIARGAGVPIVPVAFDWRHKVIRILPSLFPTALEPDLARLRAAYADIHGHGE